MGFKARELEGMSKAELIKALRALMVREAKLKKKYDGLLDQLAKRACEPNPGEPPSLNELAPATAAELERLEKMGKPALITLVEKGASERDATLAFAKELRARRAKLPGIGPCKPAFPWEPK